MNSEAPGMHSTNSLLEAHRNTSAAAKSVIFLAAEQILRFHCAFLQLQICGLHTIQLSNLILFVIAFVGFHTI
jgi:hypothetical protein